MQAVYEPVAAAAGTVALRFPFLEEAGGEQAGGLTARFTTRHAGNLSYLVGDDPATVARNRRAALALAGVAPERAVLAGLVHGSGVARIDGPCPGSGPGAPHGDPVGLAPGVDALVTAAPGVALLVTTADCVPVYLYDPVRRAVGLVHAGWRGTAAGAAARAVAALAREFGCRPGDLLAVVGPAIGPCCYEVDEPVLAALGAAPGFGPGWLRPGRRPDRRLLDLPGANAAQLLAAGLAPARVAVAGLCTACQTGTFYSHRAEAGRAGRQAAILALNGEGARP